MTARFCPHCLVRANFKPSANDVNEGTIYIIERCDHCQKLVFTIQRQNIDPEPVLAYPIVRSEAPDDYPLEVKDNFAEAIRSLNAGNPKAAVMMARSALQAATRQLGAQGGDLKGEIEDLATKHLIPDSLRQWAHEIRDGGNLAAHPEPGKRVEREDAEELLALSESIFEYLYVIPSQVSLRRARLKAKATP